MSPTTKPREPHHEQPTDRERIQLTHRLSRIEGQVRGIQRMVEADRYCVDILMQISAIHESLRKVSQVLLRDHLDRCVTNAISNGDPARRQQIYDELARLFNKYAR